MLDVAPGARGVAVAVDGEVVTRSRWPETELRDGSLVEVVAAIGREDEPRVRRSA